MIRPKMITTALRTFGRVQGRILSDRQQQLVKDKLPFVSVPEGVVDVHALFEHKPDKLVLEVGFGGGEHLAHRACQSAESGFIGCEPYLNGVASCLAHIDDNALTNVKILHGDARLLMASCQEGSFDQCYILFPDPWPKKKHHKKRLICPDTIDLLARALKPGAQLLIATDHVDYAHWITSFMGRSNDFVWSNYRPDQWYQSPDGWIKTRYQEKAEKEGRSAMFFEYERL